MEGPPGELHDPEVLARMARKRGRDEPPLKGIRGVWLLDREHSDSMEPYLRAMNVVDMAVDAAKRAEIEFDTKHMLCFGERRACVTAPLLLLRMLLLLLVLPTAPAAAAAAAAAATLLCHCCCCCCC